jgi:ferredoxin-thioredoxin reductase catalytic subunit/rubredoxin
MEISEKTIEDFYQKLKKETEAGGYFLNPDIEFTKDLLKGLLINEDRYGYQACPCRLASNNKNKDLDIICPCVYRDPDLNDYDACFCGLYVTQKVYKGLKQITSIPERRNLKKRKNKVKKDISNLSYPVWRCSVCGYLSAKDDPPEICPICKAKKERFERFI